MKNNHILLVLGLILAVCIAYWPGLHGPYVLDDDENIVLNPAVALGDLSSGNIYAALISNESGPLKRPVAAISFALNHYFNGGFYPAFQFKVTNLAIHIVNTFLIYLLSLNLLRTPRLKTALNEDNQQHIAIFTAALWTLHPIQLTSVLYVVQRMNSLSALFVLSGLLVFMWGRQGLERGATNKKFVMAAGVTGGTLLGIGAKENAVLLPVFALVLELTLYHRDHLSFSNKIWLWGFYLLTVVFPAILLVSYLLLNPDFFFDTYAMRPFSPLERLMTEMRVLWFYLSLLLVPSIQRLGLFHDDIQISTELFQPFVTFPAVIGIIALLAFALAKFRRYPLVSFAILWYLAGHSVESSIFGLEISYEHRNYLPSYGVLFAAAHTINNVLANVKARQIKMLTMSLPYAIVLVFGFGTWTWAYTWRNSYSLAEFHAANHPDSPRANKFAASVEILEKNNFVRAIQYTVHGIHVAPDEVGFRLDMRGILAHLESEINSGLNKAQFKTQGKEFRIDALPNSIRISNVNGAIKFFHDPSNGRTISEMLRHMPISVHGVVALDKLTTCIHDDIPSCMSLHHEAIEWLDSATVNPSSTVAYRAFILSRAAKLHAKAGNLQQALDYITRADQLAPGTVYYRLGKAEYLAKLGKSREATSILSEIADSGVVTEKDRETINLLRKIQADAR